MALRYMLYAFLALCIVGFAANVPFFPKTANIGAALMCAVSAGIQFACLVATRRWSR